jgi:death-on-curing protein
MVNAMHLESITAFGGSSGIRDSALLESALQRPRNLDAYGDDPSIFDLAAAYCAGIVGNHPYIDGNKRAGLLAAQAFLALNGYDFRPVETDVVGVLFALAAGEIDEAAVSAWLSEFSTRRG